MYMHMCAAGYDLLTPVWLCTWYPQGSPEVEEEEGGRQCHPWIRMDRSGSSAQIQNHCSFKKIHAKSKFINIIIERGQIQMPFMAVAVGITRVQLNSLILMSYHS